jgi:hypothetical protein
MPSGRRAPLPEPPVPSNPPVPSGQPVPPGQLIKQRDAALNGLAQASTSQPIAAIAPDGLDSFARDLRALRAKAELDYPEMAERSHYTMKTLASAAGGLRLPTLPVLVAYIHACDGDLAEWEERWHKLSEKFGPETTTADDEPAEPPVPLGADPEPARSEEVYVITSAKPRLPGW